MPKSGYNNFLEVISGVFAKPKIFYDTEIKLKTLRYKYIFNPDAGFVFRRYNLYNNTIDLLVIPLDASENNKEQVSYVNLKCEEEYNFLESFKNNVVNKVNMVVDKYKKRITLGEKALKLAQQYY